jgi:hypothetical protein
MWGKTRETTGFSRVALQFHPTKILLIDRVETSDFSRVEFQFRPTSREKRQKLKLHAIKIGGLKRNFEGAPS